MLGRESTADEVDFLATASRFGEPRRSTCAQVGEKRAVRGIEQRFGIHHLPRIEHFAHVLQSPFRDALQLVAHLSFQLVAGRTAHLASKHRVAPRVVSSRILPKGSCSSARSSSRINAALTLSSSTRSASAGALDRSNAAVRTRNVRTRKDARNCAPTLALRLPLRLRRFALLCALRSTLRLTRRLPCSSRPT